MNISISFLGSISFGWLHEKCGIVYDETFFMDPVARIAREEQANALAARYFPDFPIYNFEAHLVQVEGRRRPVALVGGLQPNLILGAAVGARFVFQADKDPDITPTPLAGLKDLDPLRKINWASTWPVSRFLDQIHETREALGAHYTVIPPFFWDTTGRATFHGIVTTAQKLMGEEIFLKMVHDPPFVHEFFDWIVESYAALSRLLAKAAGLTVTGVHIGDCSACMIGPGQFEEFMGSPLAKLAQGLGPLRLHSCGFSDHLLDVFAKLGGLLQCLNVGSNTSVDKIRRRLGTVRIDLIPDIQLMTYGRPGEVADWVRKSIEQNAGGRLEFQHHLDLAQPEENILAIPRTLAHLGHACPREQVY